MEENIVTGSSSGNKKLKLQAKEDRISDLPDSLIQHILSFLPSTKQSIQTGILSKRWKNLWTRVPILIFDNNGKPDKNFSQFIDRTLTLHNCWKLKKFHIQHDRELGSDPQLTLKNCFAISRDVDELILHLYPIDMVVYKLPEFVTNNTSLLKLDLIFCDPLPDLIRIPNWSRLKELKLECSRFGSGIKNVVSRCPVLELLELSRCAGFTNDAIVSESLKRLISIDVSAYRSSDWIEISCPNLEQLSVKISGNESIFTSFPDQMIENVLSSSPLLHTLEITDCRCFDPFVIASKSLKKLVLGVIYRPKLDFEISCPNLEELNLYSFVPNSLSSLEDFVSKFRCLAMTILRQVQNVKVLEIGSWFIKLLSAFEFEGLSSNVLNCKCLTLDGTDFDKNLPGIVRAIRSSPALEKLVIKLQLDKRRNLGYPPEFNDCGKKKRFWNSSVWTVFNCSVSNLKTVKIVGFSDEKHNKLVLAFVEFLLKNARVLEKIDVILADCGKGFLFEVSKKMLSLQRCFPHTNIELKCPNL